MLKLTETTFVWDKPNPFVQGVIHSHYNLKVTSYASLTFEDVLRIYDPFQTDCIVPIFTLEDMALCFSFHPKGGSQ